MDQQDLIAQQDEMRTKRAFISFLSTALGADQMYAGQDASAVNPPYRYQVIGPTGVGIEGAPVSTAQSSVRLSMPVALAGVGVLVALLLVMRSK
jgi:hypothetical protein